MTITEMIAKIWPRMGTSSVNDFFTEANLTDLLNDGYRDFVSVTRFLRKFILIDIVAETQKYDLPSDSLQPLWFGYDGQGITPTSVASLDILDEQWVGQASGVPSRVAVGLDGMEKFYLYVPPSTSSTALGNSTTSLTDFEGWVDNILFYYEYEIETDLTAGQTPDLETPFQWALIYYALWKALEKEGESQDLVQAALWQERYYQKAEEKKSLLSDVRTIVIGNHSVVEAGEEEKAYPDMIEWRWEEIDEIILDADGTIYFGRQNTDGTFPSGTWKVTRLGDNLIFYRYESGWIEKVRI